MKSIFTMTFLQLPPIGHQMLRLINLWDVVGDCQTSGCSFKHRIIQTWDLGPSHCYTTPFLIFFDTAFFALVFVSAILRTAAHPRWCREAGCRQRAWCQLADRLILFLFSHVILPGHEQTCFLKVATDLAWGSTSFAPGVPISTSTLPQTISCSWKPKFIQRTSKNETTYSKNSANHALPPLPP